MATRTWEGVELPILEAVVAAHQQGGAVEDVDALAEHTGLDRDVAVGAVRVLLASGHLEGIDGRTMAGEDYGQLRPLAPGLRATGAWPSTDPFDEVVRLLEQRIAEEPDPEQQQKLRGWRDHLLDVGKGVASGVLTTAMRAAMGTAV